jgi:hypothetical protein
MQKFSQNVSIEMCYGTTKNGREKRLIPFADLCTIRRVKFHIQVADEVNIF